MGLQGEELSSDAWCDVEVSGNAETIATFWKDLLELRPAFFLEDLSALFHTRFLSYMEAGRSEEFHPKRLLLSDPVLASLCKDHPDLELLASNRLKAREKIDPVDLIEAIIHLFGSAEGLCKAYVRDVSQESCFLAAVEGRYKLLGSYSPALVRLECALCGRSFASTPASILSGIGCPHCNRALDDEAILARAVGAITKGRWRYLSGYAERPHIPSLEEVATGRVERVSVPRLFFYGEDALKTAEPQDCIPEGFILLSQRKNGNHYTLELMHEDCGGFFTVLREDFIRQPFCRCCDGNRDPERAVARAGGGTFIWTGDKDKGLYSASDGKTELSAHSLSALLRKVERVASYGTKRRDLRAERARIDDFIARCKGEVFFLEDMASLADGQTVRNYCSRLSKLGIIKPLPGVGVYCNALEEHSLAEVLASRFCIRHGVRIGLPLCDSLFLEAGWPIEEPRAVYGVHKERQTVKSREAYVIDGRVVAHIIQCPVAIGEEKWQAAALVLTVKYRKLCTLWSRDAVSQLVSWLKACGIKEGDLSALRAAFPSHIVNQALSLLWCKEGLWEEA